MNLFKDDMYSGLIALPWWGYVVVALVLTHITIAAVTIFLHRHQAHRALDLHPLPSHFFRFWLWLTTGMVTKEWAAVHRKHHAKVETEEDPHSPQILGINKILWAGVGPYRVAANDKELVEKYGTGTPDDWLERHLYAKHPILGIVLMGVVDLVLFGAVPGALIYGVQMLWIPFFAAGVINGIGHYWGYRNFACEDASTNIVPWGILIGGEELHNNHHAYGTSARLSNKWYEFDIGWLYIRLMEMAGLAKVKKLAPKIKLNRTKTVCDLETLHSVITHRYDVMAKFSTSLKRAYNRELQRLGQGSPQRIAALKHWLQLDAKKLPERDKASLLEVLKSNKALHTMYHMRQELASLWERSTASPEQLLKQLQDWCHRAEQSGIEALQQFSRRLRAYA